MNDTEECLSVLLPHRVYDKIEIAVVELYKELQINRIPIEPFSIARQLGYCVNSYYELEDHERRKLRINRRDGLSFFNPYRRAFSIYYDSAILSNERIRFTIMHEIGHIRLGHREESELARKMADYFAAYSLAPSPLISHYKCEDYVDVSNVFQISEESAMICFDRYSNWLNYGGEMKDYEMELLKLFIN